MVPMKNKPKQCPIVSCNLVILYQLWRSYENLQGSLNFLRSNRSARKDHMETELAFSSIRLDIEPRLFPPHYRSHPPPPPLLLGCNVNIEIRLNKVAPCSVHIVFIWFCTDSNQRSCSVNTNTETVSFICCCLGMAWFLRSYWYGWACWRQGKGSLVNTTKSVLWEINHLEGLRETGHACGATY